MPVQTECMSHTPFAFYWQRNYELSSYYAMVQCCLQTLTDCMCLVTGNEVTSLALENLESSKKY